jgi:hypothetical protein
MSKYTGIAYEPHPVTLERKAELRAQGLQIIDIRFKPDDVEVAEAEAAVEAQEEAPVRRGRKAKAE